MGVKEISEQPLRAEGREARIAQNTYLRPVWGDTDRFYNSSNSQLGHLLKVKERRESETFQEIGESL